MTEQEREALDWAIARLKACRDDSEKMAKRVVSCTALDNIRNYDNLVMLRTRLSRRG